MSFLDSISNIFTTRSKDWVFGRLDQNQLPAGEGEPREVPPNQAYLEIILKSARIVKVRKGLNKFYGMVHSHATLPMRDKKTEVAFDFVTTPSILNKVDAANLDRVVSVNRTVLGPVPYRSAPLDIEIGLFSVKEAELAGPYLKVLEDLSSAAGVAFVQQAMPFVGPLTNAINLLAGGAADIGLEIGVQTSLSATTEPLTSGWYAVIRADRTELDLRNLRVTPTDFRLVDGEGNPVADYPYMVFELAAARQRDDWFEIPDVSARYEDLRKEVLSGDRDRVQQAFAAFKRTTLLSHDLLIEDAKRIADEVEKELLEVMPKKVAAVGFAKAMAGSRGRLPKLSRIRIYDDPSAGGGPARKAGHEKEPLILHIPRHASVRSAGRHEKGALHRTRG